MKARGRLRSRRRKPGRPGRVKAPVRSIAPDAADDRGEIVGVVDEIVSHPEGGPRLSGGDLDADWVGAYAAGDEAVGGSTSTPDQDVVDEIGEALGVQQPSDGEVHTSDEILRRRDRLRWHLERDAADEDEGRPAHHRRGAI